MLFMPAEIASLMEAKLNETQEGLESPFIFRTDTMLGRYTRDYFVDDRGQKREFIYTVVTDPSGSIFSIPHSNLTTQSIELHIYFKIKYRDRMYETIDKFLSNMSGLFMEIPGTALASGENTKVTFTTNIPYFGEPMDQNIKTINERTGLETNSTMGFIEAVIPINMTTCTSDVMMGNELSYVLSQDGIEEMLMLSKDSMIGRKVIQATEQYINQSTSETINSANNFQCSLSFFVKGDLTTKIMKKCINDYKQNEVYTLKIFLKNDLLGNIKVLLTDPTIGAIVGGYTIISVTFTTADKILLESEE